MSKRLSFREQKEKQKARRKAARLALFATTTPSEPRNRLLMRFLRMQEAFGASDPEALLSFLKEQRRGFDFSHDGPSEAMGFVDELRRVNAA